MKKYLVQIPIAGHICHEVEADNEDEAKEKALDMDPDTGDLSWVTLDSFCEGNVCYCPSPWEITVHETE